MSDLAFKILKSINPKMTRAEYDEVYKDQPLISVIGNWCSGQSDKDYIPNLDPNVMATLFRIAQTSHESPTLFDGMDWAVNHLNARVTYPDGVPHIVYLATLADMERKRYTTLRATRFAARFGFNGAACEYFAATLKAAEDVTDYSAYSLHVAESVKAVEFATQIGVTGSQLSVPSMGFKTGRIAASCMKYDSGNLEITCNPFLAYMSPDFKIYYVKSFGEVVARSIVQISQFGGLVKLPAPRFVKVYARDTESLRYIVRQFSELGIHAAKTHMGAQYKIVRDSAGNFVMPYSDANSWGTVAPCGVFAGDCIGALAERGLDVTGAVTVDIQNTNAVLAVPSRLRPILRPLAWKAPHTHDPEDTESAHDCHCHTCGIGLYSDYDSIHTHDHDDYCESCFESNFSQCDDCGDYEPSGELNPVESADTCVCNYCLRNNYFSSDHSNDYFRNEERETIMVYVNNRYIGWDIAESELDEYETVEYDGQLYDATSLDKYVNSDGAITYFLIGHDFDSDPDFTRRFIRGQYRIVTTAQARIHDMGGIVITSCESYCPDNQLEFQFPIIPDPVLEAALLDITPEMLGLE